MSLTEPLIQPTGTAESEKSSMVHVDDFLDDVYVLSRTPHLKYVHFMFSHWRKPAIEKLAHEPFMAQFKLFVDWKGKTYRVTGASRLGDVYLTSDFNRNMGYEHRVGLDFTQLTNWRDKADWLLSWPDRIALSNQFYDTAIPENAAKSNKYTGMMMRLGQPACYMDCSAEERQFLFERMYPTTQGTES